MLAVQNRALAGKDEGETEQEGWRGKARCGPFPPEFGLTLCVCVCVCVCVFFKRKCILVWACGEEKDQRGPLGAVFGGSPRCSPHTLPLGWGLPGCRCQGTRWRPTVKGAVWGGLGAAFTYSEALAPLKPRRCQFPGLRSSNRLLALGSSLLVEISSTYFSDDVTHSDFLHFESWSISKTFREASKKHKQTNKKTNKKAAA